MRRILILIAIILALAPCIVLAEDPGDYDYRFPVTIANDTGSNFDYTPVAVPVYANNLYSNNFMQADGGDILFTDDGMNVTHGTAQDLTSNDATWWMVLDTLTDGTSRTMYVHTGDSTADRDQDFFLTDSDTVTVSHAASLNVTNNLTLSAKVEIPSLPAGREYLIKKLGQYYLSMDSANFKFTVFDNVSAAGSQVSYTTGDDTDYDVGDPVTDWEAQTFTTWSSPFVLKNVQVKVTKTGTPTTLHAGLRATDGSGLPTGADLSSGSITGTSVGDGWHTITMTAYELQPSTKYALLLSATAAAGSYFEWYADSSSPAYANGNRAYSVNSGASWTASTGDDFMFDIRAIKEVSATTAASTSLITVKGTYDGSNVKIYLDDVEMASTANAIAVNTGTSTLTVDVAGFVYHTRVGGTSVVTPTWVLNLEYEPDEIAQTDAGDAGDGWTWEGTITDQSASTNDATYALVRDMTDITVTVGALQVKETPSMTMPSSTPIAIIGTMPDISLSTPSPMTGILTDTIEGIDQDSGMPRGTLWAILLAAAGVAGMVGVYRAVPINMVAHFVIPLAFVMGMALRVTDMWFVVPAFVWALSLAFAYKMRSAT